MPECREFRFGARTNEFRTSRLMHRKWMHAASTRLDSIPDIYCALVATNIRKLCVLCSFSCIYYYLSVVPIWSSLLYYSRLPISFFCFCFCLFYLGIHTAWSSLRSSGDIKSKCFVVGFGSGLRIRFTCCTGFFFAHSLCVRRWLQKRTETTAKRVKNQKKNWIEFRERAKYSRLVKRTWAYDSKKDVYVKCNTFYYFVRTVVVFNFNPSTVEYERPQNNERNTNDLCLF